MAYMLSLHIKRINKQVCNSRTNCSRNCTNNRRQLIVLERDNTGVSLAHFKKKKEKKERWSEMGKYVKKQEKMNKNV
jgi:predicted lipoprotein with Yx(FWY)xxD motif